MCDKIITFQWPNHSRTANAKKSWINRATHPQSLLAESQSFSSILISFICFFLAQVEKVSHALLELVVTRDQDCRTAILSKVVFFRAYRKVKKFQSIKPRWISKILLNRIRKTK